MNPRLLYGSVCEVRAHVSRDCAGCLSTIESGSPELPAKIYGFSQFEFLDTVCPTR